MGCQNLTNEQCSNVFLLSEQLGYWRNFGFGIASVYNSDFNTVGGFGKFLDYCRYSGYL